MKKREQKFVTLFKNWCEFKKDSLPDFVFEAKNVKENKSFNIKQMEDHQIVALNKVWDNDKNLYYKIPDTDFNQKPFDGFFINNKEQKCKAYIVINFEKQGFVLINIDKIKPKIDYKDSLKICDFHYHY